MSLMKILTPEAVASLSDEAVGGIVSVLLNEDKGSVASIGAMVRNNLSSVNSPPTGTASAASAASAASIAVGVTTGSQADSLMAAIESAFNGEFSRRSLSALARITGLSENQVLDLVDGRNNFAVRDGRSGQKLVQLLGDVPEFGPEFDSFTESLYSSFRQYRRRKVSSLAVELNIRPDALTTFLADNDDFTLNVGRNSGSQFVSITGLNG